MISSTWRAALILVLGLSAAAYGQTAPHATATARTYEPTARAGETVTYNSGSETVKSELFLPPESPTAKHPALIVIHEWWGLNDWVRQQAREFADAGYITLAVDLYRGQVATDPMMAHELMRGVPQDRERRDLLAAYSYLRSRKDVGSKDRIGVVGWCMGGGYAIDFATMEPGLSAVVVNYGSLPTDTDALKKIDAPVLGSFGAQDRGITPQMVQTFEQQMHALGKQVSIKEYPDAGHAFENPNNTAGYRPADAADAHARIMQFLREHLMQ